MKIELGGITFGYDRAGSGEPVLLVMGLGTPRIGWFHQFAFLSQAYDVTSFDNRGCGETVFDASWTLQDMAADAIALADAMGYERFHLAGISMGGMISQEIALAYPDRLRSLTLIATCPGGPEAQFMTPEYAAALALPDPKERMRRATELTFGEKFRREQPRMMKLILDALDSGIAIAGAESLAGDASAGFLNQMTAVMGWLQSGGAAAKLKDVRTPTLVMHGGDDLLLPFKNGEVIAREVPEARFRPFPEAGHAMNAEYPDDVNAELVAHLEEASARV